MYPQHEDEIFLSHPTYPLDVSNLGRVRSHKTGRILKGFLSGGASAGARIGGWRPNTYRRIAVGKGYGVQNPSVQALVLETFVGPRPDGFEAAHKNGDRQDNRLSNLAWMLPGQNRRKVAI